MASRSRASSGSSETPNSLHDLLSSTTVMDLASLRKQHTTVFKSTDLVSDVLDTLTNKEILSAPVYSDEKQSFVGMVDLRDFVAYILALHMKGEVNISTADKLCDFSGTDPFVPCNDDFTMLDVVKEFTVKELHRMPVLEKNNKAHVLCILSQSLVVDWLSEHVDKFPQHVQDKTLKELNMAVVDDSEVLMVYDDETVLAAFSMIEKYNVQGVAVVNRDGILIGNISVSDLKFFVKSSLLEALQTPIRDFFHKQGSSRVPLVTCSPDSKFLDVLKLFSKHKVHRVHIVDPDQKPVDIITLSNVLDTVVNYATGVRRRK